MQYQNLNELFQHSSSSRQYFLSLPVEIQLQVSEYGTDIHTAAQLHETVRLVKKHQHAVMLSESLDTVFKRKPPHF